MIIRVGTEYLDSMDFFLILEQSWESAIKTAFFYEDYFEHIQMATF